MAAQKRITIVTKERLIVTKERLLFTTQMTMSHNQTQLKGILTIRLLPQRTSLRNQETHTHAHNRHKKDH